MVQHWESGKTAPKRKRLATVASLLGVTVQELLGAEASKGGVGAAVWPEEVSLEVCLRKLAAALCASPPAQREVACNLLVGLARSPENLAFVSAVVRALSDRGERVRVR